MRRLSLVLSLLFLATTLVADEHRILDAQHVLSDDEKAALAARGLEIQRPLANGRYLVRIADGSDVTARDPRIRSLEPLTAAKKLQPSAYRAAAGGKVYARVRVLFHDDVPFDAARDAIVRAGGTVDDVFARDFDGDPRSIVARIPSMSLTELASDDRVLVVTGPPLRAKSYNQEAAALSKVDVIQAAPYNLTGDGVVLGIFEVEDGRVDEAHGEFQGRVVQHVTGIGPGGHATHVAGTMIAAGLNPRAKGMAPKATLHSFAGGDPDDHYLTDRRNLSSFNVAAENNSWGYVLGWCEPSRCSEGWVWVGFDELNGGYDGFYSATIDKTARTNGSLSVWSSGNEADLFGPFSAPFAHKHLDEDGEVIDGELFCYSSNGSGTDCPAAQCSSGPGHCEITRHPTHVPYGSVGLTASVKNVLSVGATNDDRSITGYSSRGPTRDGRVKPELVANGASVFSTFPGGQYGTLDGTSMSSPVVTGIAALLTEQWKKLLGSAPLPVAIRAALLAGADDLGLPGPDYTYGFGFANAKASADLIINDRIRIGGLVQGATFETDITVLSPQTLRVLATWLDPEVILFGDELAEATLVNDLDLKVITPSGQTVLPYVLDPNSILSAATRAANKVDNIEEVEIANAPAGVYHVVLTATRISAASPQQFAFASSVPIGNVKPPCVDLTEPNNSEAQAYGFLALGVPVGGRICDQADVDFFKIRADKAGVVSVTVTSTDTPLRVTLNGQTATIAAGAIGTVSTTVGAAAELIVKIEATAAPGADGGYTLSATFPTEVPKRRRAR
ncbi:MAG TPA: S8 family serine peptidase [Thermoanaerobaculia bacterium]|nr:S8 family serine peptidase [Thermoanaerobaculia bacterium]